MSGVVTPTKKKRHRLTNMQYDEVSLVDKGANQLAHVVIIKREAKAPVGNMPKNRKADYYNAKTAKNPSARSSSWDEKKHPRKPKGSPAGGEFDETSDESKEKYGKDGTTKEKLERKTAKHTTKKGDTLWDLAEKHYGDGSQWKKIARANGIKDPRKLPVGKELKIPGSKLAGKDKSDRKGASTAKPKYRKVMEPGGRVHVERIPETKKPKKKTHQRRTKKKASEVKKLALHNMFMNYTSRG